MILKTFGEFARAATRSRIRSRSRSGSAGAAGPDRLGQTRGCSTHPSARARSARPAPTMGMSNQAIIITHQPFVPIAVRRPSASVWVIHQVRRQPSLDLGEWHPLPRCVAFHLVARDEVDGEVTGLRMREVETADRRTWV